jgi:hypothetical protein
MKNFRKRLMLEVDESLEKEDIQDMQVFEIKSESKKLNFPEASKNENKAESF